MSWVADKTRQYVYFTWTAQKDASPVEITGGQGSWFEVSGGKRYLDFACQVFNANLGHQHPRLIRALKEQADTLCVAGPRAAYPAKALLGEKLASISPPGLVKTFFTLGGAEANENAVKMARMVTGRFKVITRYRSYHGATLGALSLTGDPRRLPFEPTAPGVVHVHDPYCHRCPFGHRVETCHRECVRQIEDTIRFEGPESVAAVLVEGFSGTNGVMVPPDDYWPRLREICDRHGILLISDEVFTGLGRTGRWFAVDHWSVAPDMITLAKGLGAGHVPLGAVLTSERIGAWFDSNKLWCGLTNYAPPLCVAVALEALQTYGDEGLVDRARDLGSHLMERLQEIQRAHPLAGDVRGKGLLALIELSHPGSGEPLVPWNATAVDMKRLGPLRRTFDEKGLFIDVHWNFIIIAPPLNISREDLDVGLDVISEGLQTLEKEMDIPCPPTAGQPR